MGPRNWPNVVCALKRLNGEDIKSLKKASGHCDVPKRLFGATIPARAT